MSHSIVFEEADDLQKLAADVENVLSSARVGASLPINTTSQTSYDRQDTDEKAQLLSTLQGLLDRIDKSLLYHTSQNYPHLSSLHKKVQSAHQSHVRLVVPKLNQLQKQLSELQQLLVGKIDALSSKLQYKRALTARKALLDTFIAAANAMDKLETLIYDNVSTTEPKSLQELLPAVFDASKQCELNAEWQPLWRACYLYRDLLVLKNRSITTVAAISAAPSQVGGDTLPFWISMNERMLRVKAVLLHALDTLFEMAYPLSSKKPAELPYDNLQIIQACLMGYELLSAHHHIESRILAKPPLDQQSSRIQQLITNSLSTVFSQSKSHITTVNISPLFDAIIAWVKENVVPLIQASFTLNPDPDSGFNFVLRGIWIPLFSALASDTPLQDSSLKGFTPSSVFSPRDAQIFHDNYLAFCSFTDQLELLCPSEEHVKAFRQHDDYKSFLRRWDIDTYFAMRKVEIAGQVEKALTADTSLQPAPKTDGRITVLQGSRAVEEALFRCLNPSTTFLVRAAHNFFKLALQIVERFRLWALSSISSCSSYQKVEQLFHIVKDADELAARLEAEPNGNVQSSPVSSSFTHVLASSFPDNASEWVRVIRKGLSQAAFRTRADILSQSRNYILDYLFCLCIITTGNPMSGGQSGGCDLVAQVRSIRALFQVPNRPKPTQPLSYARSLLQPLYNYLVNPATQNAAASAVSQELRREWIIATIDRITTQYADLVSQLIDAHLADKTAVNGVGASRPLLPDSEKVLQQLVLDVDEVARQISTSFQLEPESISSFVRLRQLVNTR